MIIIRYLVRETLKSQLAILFILLLIFFCQKLVRILGAAVDGDHCRIDWLLVFYSHPAAAGGSDPVVL